MSARILLVDDHPVICTGIRLTLEKQGDLTVVGEAHNREDALLKFRELAPDLVILDIELGSADGLALAAQMLTESPQTRVIVFSAHVNLQLVDRALQAGVKGYMVKAKAESELVQAVREVLSGRCYLCAEVTNEVVANYRKHAASNDTGPTLTERELEVLKLTAEGLRVKDIATRLNIGVKTVDTYRSSLFAKLGCSSVADLTRYAIRQGIITP